MFREALTMFSAPLLVGIWLISHHVSFHTWVFTVVYFALGMLCHSAGYNRLWAHGTYKTMWWIKCVMAVFASGTPLGSILIWCERHRRLHQEASTVSRGSGERQSCVLILLRSAFVPIPHRKESMRLSCISAFTRVALMLIKNQNS